MDVLILPVARAELRKMPIGERKAMLGAVDKLQVYGDRLASPHSSNVQGADRVRELRPRAGRSPWRAFYRRVGDVMVIGAVGPEAEQDRRGFARASRDAVTRLNAYEDARRHTP